MSEQDRIAFEAWYDNDISEPLPDDYTILGKRYLYMGWQSATAEANKRIEALEGEVAGLRFECASKDLHTDTLLEQLEEARISNTELKASNNTLREAFNDLAAIVNRGSPSCKKGVVDKCKCTTCVIDRGSATPAESLQAHENSVIEKCANVATDACLVPPDGGTPMSYEVELCDAIAEAIRALKEVK